MQDLKPTNNFLRILIYCIEKKIKSKHFLTKKEEKYISFWLQM